MLKKPKANSTCWNIKNFKHWSQKEMYNPKSINCYDLCRSQNENHLSFVIILLWEVIYVHFYNWDWPLDFVPVVYDLIELKIEASLWFMDYFTFNTHTKHTRLCSDNAYLICEIVHVQMWCVCSSTCWSNPKIFLSVLYVFESDFILSCF